MRHDSDRPSDRELAELYRVQVRDIEDVVMFVTTPEGSISTWNRGVEKSFGYAEHEWIGRHISVIFTEEDRAAGIPESEMRIAAEQERAADVRWHRRNDGTHVYMSGVLRAIRDDAGKLTGFTKVVIDETSRKHLEDALTQSNTDLQQFAYVASHDLQDPLRTINSFSQLLHRRYADRLDADAKEFLQIIADSAQRMSLLIRDLLTYAQIVQEEIRTASVHLDDDLEAALALLRTSLEETGTTVTHEALPKVWAERSQMVRLFQNLIGNAIKFRKPDEPQTVHVSAERGDDYWTIRVRDNGIGFSREHRDLIFAPFKRLHGAEYPGSGIGLAACKRIVERYGGRIGADSEPGAGSTFWFTLPAGEAGPHNRQVTEPRS